MNLLEDFESGEQETSFSINKGFAKRFEHNKKREEKQKLEELYGSEDEDDSESDEVEDEDGELITPQLDAQIMKTIHLLQKRDSSMYDPATNCFNAEELDEAKRNWEEKRNPVKPVLLKDYQRSQLLGGVKESNTFVEEQKMIKDEFREAVSKQDEDGDLFTIRKEEAAIDPTDGDYSKYLLSQMFTDEKEKVEWKESKKDDKEQAFLMDFVLGRGWVDTEKEKIPTYQELTLHDSTDDDDEERMDQYETNHNFRYEEGGSEFVVTHARNIPGIIRRKDTSRVLKREAEKEKKLEHRTKKDEDLKRLKNLKREELKRKLKQIQDMAGGDLIGLEDIDLANDFDPEEYDKRMNNVFTDDYYATKGVKSAGKPTWDDEIDISDFIPPTANELEIQEDEQMEEPIIEDSASKEQIDKYMEEYYQLDYEDLIGDLPVRFKYRKIEANNYSLKPEEILQADDHDLNNVVSLKKLGPFRSVSAKAKDAEKWKLSKKKKLWEFRAKLKGKDVKGTEEISVTPGEKRLKKEAKIGQSRLDAYSSKRQ